MTLTQTHNFLVGTCIFAAIAFVLGCFLPLYVGSQTKDVTQKNSNRL
jgi:hypothetical protein